MKRIMIVCAAFAALAVSTLQAVEVTPGQAKTAAGNWVRRNQAQMKSKFRSTSAKETLTARDASGRALYHAVNLEGGGFVVTSGDTRLTPVVAFSETGCYRADKDNPLYVLLQADRSNAVAAVNGPASKGTRTNDRIAAAESEWKSLLSNKRDGGNGSKGSAPAMSGVYVDKLIKTQWGQSSWDGYVDGTSVFNYSTPNNYVCGCVATVGAQIMRYWQYPTAEIPQFSNMCAVDESPVTRYSIAGAFNWANMPLSSETTPTPTEDQKQAIGMLTYNVGVAVGMSWHSDASGASPYDLSKALETRFGYQSGGTYVLFNAYLPLGYTAQAETIRNALYASLDAGMPVCVSVQNGLGGGHAVIADGYGHISGTDYTHLNMGWAGIDDAWYDLADVLPGPGSSSYSIIDGLVFNIHPTKKGDVISGRVRSAKYTDLAGAMVTLCDSSKNPIETTTTSESGVYSFRVTATGTYYLQATYNSVSSEFTEVDMSALSSSGTYDMGGFVGNKWGVNLTVETAIKADASDPGDNTAAGGTLLTPTDEERTHGPHTLSETDEQDFFRIEMTPGTKYVFESTGGGTMLGELFSSASADPGSCVAYSSDGGVGSNFKIEYFPPSAGTYYLRVATYGTEAVYSLKYSALALSKPSTYLKVEGYYPSVNCTLGSNSVNFASTVECDGGWTVSVDDTSWVTLTTDCGVGDGFFYFSLPENTGYNRSCVFTVKAGSFTAYKNLTQYGPLGAKPVLGDDSDPGDDTGAGGTWLTPTATVQTHGPHTLTSTDLYDFFRISMTAGTTYVFETTGSSDTIGELYSSASADSSSLVIDNDDIDGDGGNFNFKIEYTPSVSQTYYLRVKAYDRSDASYSLNYSCNAPAPVQNTVTFNANGGSGSPTTRTVESGASVGTLPTPTRNGWTFTGWFTAVAGGTQVSAATKVTADVTYYARWTQDPDPVTPTPVDPDPVTPTPVNPVPGPSCYAALDASEIVAPYLAPKTVTLQGAAYNGCSVAGVVELKLGKVNAKKGTSKVSGSVTTLDGKKHAITAVTLAGVDGTAPMSVSLTVRDLGTMDVTIGGTEFAGSLGGWHVQSAGVGGNWTSSGANVYVDVANASLPDAVLADFLPDGEPVIPAGGKWKFAKATSVKWAKPKRGAAVPDVFDADSGKGLVVDTSSGKTNLSGLKLTYTPKKGTFKGSFKLYALEGTGKATKLKKYTVKVSGVVVDGVGYGTATCKSPALACPVTVE